MGSLTLAQLGLTSYGSVPPKGSQEETEARSAAWPWLPGPTFSYESWRPRAAGTRSRSRRKALSRAERLAMLCSRRQKTLPEVRCSVPRSFYPSEPHPGGNNRNLTAPEAQEQVPPPDGVTTRPNAPCLCWVSAPTNDNWPSDKSAGPANSSPPACPCTSHLSLALPAPGTIL